VPAFVYPDPYLRRILRETKTIALVGASPNPDRPSWQVMTYMQSAGYRIIPVNPGQAGNTIHGETIYETLSAVPDSYDMVDVFRASSAVAAIVDESIGLAKEKGIRTIWMQLGVYDTIAANRARRAKLDVIMCRCPKIEIERLRKI